MRRAGLLGIAASVIGVAVVALLGGCSSPDATRGPVDVSEARLVSPGTVSLGVGSCHGEPEVTALEQDDDEVRVQVTSTVTDPGDACLDAVDVVLDQPLGDRDLVDLTAGEPVPVAGR